MLGANLFIFTGPDEPLDSAVSKAVINSTG